MSVSFRVSREKEFYFNVDGKCKGIVRFWDFKEDGSKYFN
jgi:hypothetical protein